MTYPPPYPYPAPSSAAHAARHKSTLNGKALASFIVGLVAVLVCVYWFLSLPAGVVALVLGIRGRIEVARGRGTNGAMATAGITMGILAVVAALAVIIVLLVTSGNDYCFDLGEDVWCTV